MAHCTDPVMLKLKTDWEADDELVEHAITNPGDDV